MRGKFITLEGIDGAGKTTHQGWIAAWLRRRSLDVCVTREPGGTPLGEALRDILLDKSRTMHLETEALLMFAARREHIVQVIEPALARGAWVVCDRYTDATFAYQGGGRGADWTKLETLERWVQGSLQPDLTILFDVPPDLGKQRSGRIKSADRFEQEQAEFFSRVRDGYLRRAREAPSRIRRIDATVAVDEIQRELTPLLKQLIR